MKYVVSSEKAPQQAVEDLTQAVKENKFGVLHTYDIRQTLNDKGVEFDSACYILEVCNPLKAKEVLNTDISLNMALPCRISVYSDGGQTRIGMIRPQAMLATLSDDTTLMKTAEEVDAIMTRIIDQAK